MRLRTKANLLTLRLAHRDNYVDYIFTRIYHGNAWGDPESSSGTGSNLQQTATLRAQLISLLNDLGIRSVLDIPCGDFNWMKDVVYSLTVTYIGADIVTQLIDRNNARFGTDNISFTRLDILCDPLPRCDLVLCRDCLVHFNSSAAARAIDNLKRSGATFLLVTHFSGDRQFKDILTGEWHPVNLLKAPFNFPEPLHLLNEGCQEAGGLYGDKCLALYYVKDIPSLKRNTTLR